jgi:tetratricopeptide (TPR) repeat protein
MSRKIIGFSLVLLFLFASITLAFQFDYKKGYELYKQKRYKEAIAEFENSADFYPEWWWLPYMIGKCHRKMGDNNQAFSYLKKAQELARKNNEKFAPIYEQAEIYFSQEDYRKAISVLSPVGNMSLDNKEKGEYYKLRGLSYMRLKDYGRAAASLSQAMRLLPDDFDAASHLGSTYLKLNDPDRAITAMLRAVELRPEDREALFTLSRAYLSKKDYKNALNYANQGIRYHPKDLRFRSLAGDASLGMKDYNNTIRMFKTVLERQPDNGLAYFRIGESYKMLEDYGNASENLLMASRYLLDEPQIFASLGFIYEKSKSYEDAIQAYDQAYKIKADPKYKEAIDRIKKRMEQEKGGETPVETTEQF